MTWLDVRNPSIGSATVDSYTQNGDPTKLSDLFGSGTDAVALRGTSYVAVGPDYFTNETQTQQIAIAIHEALHIHMRFNDPDLAGWLGNFGFNPPTGYNVSGAITDWIVGTKDLMSTIGGGCKHPSIPRTPQIPRRSR